MLEKNTSIVIEKVGSEYILFDTLKNSIYILNKTAYELWRCCENKSIKSILDIFKKSLSPESITSSGIDIIESECTQMIQEFIENGLIEDKTYGNI